jgi:hypothetical protein
MALFNLGYRIWDAGISEGQFPFYDGWRLPLLRMNVHIHFVTE